MFSKSSDIAAIPCESIAQRGALHNVQATTSKFCFVPEYTTLTGKEPIDKLELPQCGHLTSILFICLNFMVRLCKFKQFFMPCKSILPAAGVAQLVRALVSQVRVLPPAQPPIKNDNSDFYNQNKPAGQGCSHVSAGRHAIDSVSCTAAGLLNVIERGLFNINRYATIGTLVTVGKDRLIFKTIVSQC